jgi:hypothetical protein
VVGVINAFQGIGAAGSAGLGAVSVGISEALVETALGPRRRHPRGLDLQLPDVAHRVLQRGDGQLLIGARRLFHQEDRVEVR